MAISSATNNNPWYDQNASWPGVEWQDDPFNVGFQYGENNKQAAWVRRLSQMGYGGTDAKSQFAQGLYDLATEGYGAENVQQPGLYWQHYLDKLTPNFIEEQWNKQSPQGRGINTAQYSPNTQWLQRG